MKSGAFFIGEDQHFHRMSQGKILVGQGLQHFDRPHHPQSAIVFAAAGHGVNVRTQGDGRQARRRPGFSRDDIAPRVNPDFQARPTHQGGGVLAALHVGRGEGQPLHPVRGVSDASQLRQRMVEAG